MHTRQHPASRRRRATASLASLGLVLLAGCGAAGRMEPLDEEEIAVVRTALAPAPRGGVDAFGYRVDTLDRRVLTRWLADGHYDSLTTELAARWDSTRADVRYEGMLYHAYEAFFQGGDALEAPLAKWRNAMPGVAEPLLALAYYRYGRAVEARGGGSAFATSEAQFAGMRDQAEEGFKLAERALAVKPGHIVAHLARLNLMRMAEAPEGVDGMDWIQDALQANPTSFLVRDAIMSMLEPKWGGDVDMMREFAAQAKDFIPANPKLKLLEGRVALAEADMGHGVDGFDFGMERALLDQARFLGEDYFVALAYAHLHEHLDEPAEALAALARARAQYPQGRTQLAGSAPAFLKAAVLVDAGPLRDSLFAEARRAMDLVRDLRLPDEDLSYWERRLDLAVPRCARTPKAPCARIY